MPLEESLTNPDIPQFMKDFVQEQGFRTLDEVFLFLLENPSFVRRQLKLHRRYTPGRPDQVMPPPDRLSRIIDQIFEDPSLSEDVREVVRKAGERFAVLPLGVPLHANDPGPDAPGPGDQRNNDARLVTAKDFVEAVEGKARVQELLPARHIALREKIDLTPVRSGWPPNFQGDMPACVPYALASCMEVHLHRASGNKTQAPRPLSARFLYRRSRLRHFSNEPLTEAFLKGGLRLAETREALEEDGICLEGWFQNNFDIKTDAAPTLEEFLQVKQEIPPGAFADAKQRRALLDFQEFNDLPSRPAGVAEKIYDLLSAGHAVAVTIPAFSDPEKKSNNIWHSNWLPFTGILPLPSPDHVRGTLGHAVCVLGYFPNGETELFFEQYGYPSFPGYFLFRNSWGADFPSSNARNSEQVRKILGRELPEGYGLIPATVMEYFVWEYGIVKPIP
jgi:hypothetical protein